MLRRCIYAAIGFAAQALTQSAAPATSSTFIPTNPNNTIFLTVAQGSGDYAKFNIHALTQQAVNNLPHDKTSNTGIPGVLYLVDPTTSSNLSSSIIAFTACDQDEYAGGELTMTDVINREIAVNVNAIVFYSLHSAYCNISGNYGSFTNLYTMIDLASSYNIYSNLPTSNPSAVRFQYQATIYTSTAWTNFIGTNGTSGTAVAMIILYSITGLITLTFLAIIVTGAIRAHRHPERYGPRDFLGRPTQSRARGIARAILDTLPIVKFGEAKPKDVELAGSYEPQSTSYGVVPATSHLQPPTSALGSKRPSVEVRRTEQDGPAASTTSTAISAAASGGTSSAAAVTTDADEGLGCSICTDDFENGQDIRVLPCNHKFHPACVDPWLLDVSGTCPLCRIDLRPPGSDTIEAEAVGETGQVVLAPPLEVDSRRRTAVRRFFAGAINMDRAQRIETLRRWRDEHDVATTATPRNTPLNGLVPTAAPAVTPTEQPAEQRRASRLRGLLRGP